MENNTQEDKKNEMLTIYNKQKENLKNTKSDIQSITYFQDLTLIQPKDTMGIAEQEVHVVKIKDEKDKTLYELYTNGMKIATVDDTGKLQFTDEYRKSIESINKNYAKIIELNDKKEQFLLPEALSKVDIHMPKEELEKLKKDKEKNDNNEKEENKKEPKNEKEEIEEIATKLGIDKGNISSCVSINPKEKVTESDSFEKIAGVKGEYSKIFVINANGQTKGNKKFAFVGEKPNGEIENVENLKTRGSTTTDREVYSIDREGKQVKEKQTTEMYQTQDKDKMFSVTIGQYGTLQVDYIRRSPEENKWIAAPVSTNMVRPTSEEVKHFMDDRNTSKDDIDNSVKSTKEQIGENETKRTNLTQVDNNPNNDTGYDLDEKLIMHDGSVTTLREEAEKRGISPEDYINQIEHADGDCIPEKINNVNRENEKEENEEKENENEEEEEHVGREERLTPEEVALHNKYTQND